jgi:uncharacterized repeat protein (TIGR03803 family)
VRSSLQRFVVPAILLVLVSTAGADFCFPRASAQEKVLYSFTDTSGMLPLSGVIFDTQGNLYGTTMAGGNLSLCNGNGCGVVFEIVHNVNDTWTFHKLYEFRGGEDGATPASRLVFDSQGNLFGMTTYGGKGTCNQSQYSGCGTVFELERIGSGQWKEKIIYNFHGGNDGAYPAANLIFDAQGNLYGSTSLGGGTTACVNYNAPTGCGTVFELSQNANGGWPEKVLYRFAGGMDGAYPVGGLTFDATGNLYGTTLYGGYTQCERPDCGTAYRLQPATKSWTKSILYLFQGGSDGFSPVGDLAIDGSGNLYGTTIYGGSLTSSFGNGTVFELSPVEAGWSETVLYRFTGLLDGSGPGSSVILDDSGNLYGLAIGGGTTTQNYGGGTLFELIPNSGSPWSENTVYSFQNIADGLEPVGKLVRDANGNFYAGTWVGGPSSQYCEGNCGVIFQVKP